MKQVFEIPKGCNRVTIEQQNDIIIIDFKFDSPKDILFINDASNMMDSFKHLIPIIKKWREEKTRTNSVLKPEFKEGDVISTRCDDGVFIGIVKRYVNDSEVYVHACKFVNDNLGFDERVNMIKPSGNDIYFSTDLEIKILSDALAKNGKQWNAENKCVEDLKPKRWRAEYGCRYYFAMPYKGCHGYCCDAIDYRSVQDNKRYWAGNYFKTKAEANSAGLKMKELLKQINP